MAAEASNFKGVVMRALFLTLLALCFALTAQAQPLEGPWTIAERADSAAFIDPRVIIHANSAADVFFARDTTGGTRAIRHMLLDLELHVTYFVPDVAADSGWIHRLEGVYPDGTDGWFAVVFSQESSGDSNFTRVFRYSSFSVVYTGHWNPLGWGTERWTNTHVSARPGGGMALSAAIRVQWGIEYDLEPRLLLFHSGSAIPDMNADLGGALNPFYTCLAVSHHADSLLLVSDRFLQSGTWLFAFPQPTLDTLQGTQLEFDVNPIDLGVTRAGRLLAYYFDPFSAFFLTCEIGRDGNCTDLGTTGPLPQGILARTFFHADYGLAMLFVHPSNLSLARIDTSGASVQPWDIFHAPEEEWTCMSGDVTISDDGRVVVLWTERSASPPYATRLRIATIGWTTPLAGGERDHPPLPSSIGLSAYPNPFNSTLNLEYSLPRAGNVNLSVFNVLGQKVQTLVAGRMEGGTHAVMWNPECAGGVYFVTLKTETATRTTKVLYIR